ncbi:MAG: DUF1552 domain-containing protein [Myxococcota bacterium]
MKPLSRRHFLRGVGGVALALPFLDAMRPSMARAQTAAAPKRIIFSFKPNGDQIAQRFTTKGETTFAFGDFLAPLQPYRNDLLILDNVDKRFGSLPDAERADAHEQGGSSLAPWPSGEGSFPIGGTDRFIGYVLGPSADKAIGDRVLADNPNMPYRHLVYRVGGRDNNIWNLHSHAGPIGTQSPIPPETDPWAAYTRLFNGLDNGQARAAVVKALAKKRSALDLVLAEANALKTKLGPGDRAKLEKHTDSLRDLERSLMDPNVGNLSCHSFDPGTRIDPYDDDNHQAVGRLFFKIIAMAFACDMTRVVQFNWSGNTSNRVYRNLGFADGHHDLSHVGDPDSFTKIRAINQHLWTQTTFLYEELKAIQEGDGTVYDNTTIMHWNELAQGDTHSTSECMVILAGGSKYFRKGRYLDLASASRRGFENVLVSCFHAMGFTDTTSFGDARMSTGTGELPNLT